mgnify:CR=1 FL=1
MSERHQPDQEWESRLAVRLMDVFIRAGLVLALVLLCYRIFSPFLVLMLWALILAVSLYPLQQSLSRRIAGRQGLASTLLVLVGVVVIVVPTALLGSSLADSIHDVIQNVRNDPLQIPAPPASVAAWPLVGRKAHAFWSQAHADLPGLVQSMQPKIGELATKALAIVAAMGGGRLQSLLASVVAGSRMVSGGPAPRRRRRFSSASWAWRMARN